MNKEDIDKALGGFLKNINQNEREALQKTVEALTPLLGEEDAKIAVQLDHDIRTAPARHLAELQAEFIKTRLNEPGLTSRIFAR